MAVTSRGVSIGAPAPGASAWRVRLARGRELTTEILRNPLTLGGAIVIVAFLALALLAPLLAEPNRPDPYQMPRDWQAIDVPPGTEGHVLGTTSTGGDVLYGIIWGSRKSLQLSLLVVGCSVVIGLAVGSLAGFLGGRLDEILMRTVDVFLAIPELILAMAIAAVLGASFTNIILALAIVFWVKYARIIRGQILRVRENEYVDAARVMGDTRWRIYRKDVLPNSITPIVVQATLDMGSVVLIGASLSFIGLAEAGLAEWGRLVSEGQAGMVSGKWWVATFSGLAIFLWALAFNLFGDGLRDVLDPKTERR